MSHLWNRVTMLLSAVGVFIAGAMSYSEIANRDLPCGVEGGCASVTTSVWSSFFGVKVAYLGLAAYLVMLGLAVFRSSSFGDKWDKAGMAGVVFSGFGFGFSVYLQYQSIVVMGEVCAWCLASAITMFGLFLAHALLMQSETPTEEGRKPGDFSIAAGLAVLALGGIGVQAAMMREARSATTAYVTFEGVPVEEIVPRDEKLLGNADAKVTLIEFADVNCGACRNVFPRMKELYGKYGGKLRIGYRHLPLFGNPGHETSIGVAMVSEYAADNGRFWEFMDLVMAEGNTQRVKSESSVVQIAVEAGLDADGAREAMTNTDSVHLDAVSEDSHLASSRLMIGGTPTFVLIAEGVAPRIVETRELEQVLQRAPYADLLK